MAKKDLSKKQLDYLELTLSSGSPTHPFIVSLRRALGRAGEIGEDGKAKRAPVPFVDGSAKEGEPPTDRDVLLGILKDEARRWPERDAALAVLLDVKLEEVAPLPPSTEEQLQDALNKIAALEAKLAASSPPPDVPPKGTPKK